LSRVSVIKTRIWIWESVYLIFTSRNYNYFYTLKITMTIAHVTSHTKYSNYSSGHSAVSLELRNSSEFNSHFCILTHPLGTDHTQKTSHVKIISPVHWRTDCCLSTSYKHSSYCCVNLREMFIAQMVRYTCYNIDIAMNNPLKGITEFR
jgi:hypothetical protein